MHKKVLFCVSGSIAAIKAPFVVRELVKVGYEITCIISEAAKRFIQPYSLMLLSNNRCYEEADFWSENNLHIQLAQNHDVLLIAPATANTIAKCATGIADNLLLNCFLAFEGKKVIVPAMHTEMISNKVVQDNINQCKEQGIIILGPTYGELLSEDRGYGRMIEPKEIAMYLKNISYDDLNLRDQSILITAGGTTEKIDPVRRITNSSSGQLGQSLARIAHLNGAKVTIISSQAIEDVGYEKTVQIATSNQLKQSIDDVINGIDTVIMAAAISDYIPLYHDHKLRRNDVKSIPVEMNDDLLQYITHTYKPKTTIGFCLQDDINDSKTPKNKLEKKQCDYIIANDSSNIANAKRSYKIYAAKNCIDSFSNVTVNEAAYKILKAIT